MAKAKKSQKENKPTSRSAVYAGTFDPITNGHVDLIQRALSHFDEIVVVVAHSRKKSPVFDAKTRKKLIEDCFKGDPRVRVDIDSGLLVNYARKHKIPVILRGLRAVSDFEYEFQMALMNRKMCPELETFFLMASGRYFFVNSTLIKEVISHGGDVNELVPSHVEKKLRETLC